MNDDVYQAYKVSLHNRYKYTASVIDDIVIEIELTFYVLI